MKTLSGDAELNESRSLGGHTALRTTTLASRYYIWVEVSSSISFLAFSPLLPSRSKFFLLLLALSPLPA